MLSPPRPPRLPLAVAGAVLALVAACDEPVLLVVEVGLDYGTCNTSDPRQIVLGCSAIAGAWVRDGDGDILDQECVGFEAGQALSDIRTIYAGMDLNADSGTRVTVDVALFSRPPGAGCVPPDELAPEDRPEVIFAGSGRSDELNRSRGPVEVFVDCTQTPERSVAEECHLVCAGILTECESGGAGQVCQQERDDCSAGCADDACRDACAGTYEACLEESIEGACRLTNERCLEAGEQTDVECNGDYFDCVDNGCGDEHVACFQACPYPGCALFPDRP